MQLDGWEFEQLDGWEFEQLDDFHFEIHYKSKLWTSAQVIEQVFNHYSIEDVTMKELEIETMVRQIYEEVSMRKYLYMTRLTMMNAMQYKAFFLATFVSLAVKILVALYVWKTIFFTQSEVNGFTLQTFTTYIIFANLLASLNSFSLGEDLSYSILKGSIAGEFLRPYSFILALFSKTLK